MRNTKALLLLVLLLALFASAGCSVKEQIGAKIDEEIDAGIPLEKLASISIDPSTLETAFACLKPFMLICLAGVGWNVWQWLKREGGGGGWADLITGGAGKWFLLMILVGNPVICLIGFNEMAKMAWPDALDINLVRDTLGLLVPVIEANAPQLDALLPTLGGALALIPITIGWYMAYGVVLMILLPVVLLTSIVFRSLKLLIIWFAATACRAFFGTAWYWGLVFIKGYRGGNIVASTLKFVNTTFIIMTWALIIALSLLPIGAPLLAWAVGKIRGVGLGEAAWEAGQTAFLARVRSLGKPKEDEERGNGHGGKGGGRDGRGGGKLPTARQPSKQKTKPTGAPTPAGAGATGTPKTGGQGDQHPTGTGGKQQLPNSRPAAAPDQAGQPKAEGGGKQLPKSRGPGPHEAKANKISDQTGGVAKGAIATAGGPVGAAAAAAADKLPQKPSTLQSAGRATDQAKKTLHGNEGHKEKGEPLPPSRPAGGGRTRTHSESPTGENLAPSPEPQVIELGEPTTQIRATQDYTHPDSDIILCRDGQILHGDWTGDGLVTEGGIIPWEATDVGEEVSGNA